MKKLIYSCYCICLMIGLNNLHAQVATITYPGSTLSTTSCNVFNPYVKVGGFYNGSHAGGVTFNSGSGIYLKTVPSGPSIGGTAYYIAFTFTPGSVYSIAITTSGGDNIIQLSTSVVYSQASFLTSSTTSCTPDPYVNGYMLQGFGKFSTTVAPATTTYTIPNFQITGNQPQGVLMIWASGGNAGLSSDGFYISSVKITQTSALFSVSPSSVSVTCGTTLNVPMSITNVNSVPGVINYTWNLGTVPNGWQYQGVAAPAAVTTSANSITLTAPACGTLPHTVAAVANLTGSTNVAAGNIPPVNLNAVTISGPASMCGQPTVYSLANFNCPGATVTWSASPAGNVGLSCTTCAQTTLTKIVNGSTITLSANITNGCNATQPPSRPIDVDAVNNLTGTYSTNTTTKPIQTVNFVPVGSIAGQYSWPSITNISLTHTGSGTWSYGGTNTFGFYLASGQNMTLNFSGISGACGTVTATRTFLQSSFGPFMITTSPNPVTSDVNVAFTPISDSTMTMEKAQSIMATGAKSAKTTISIYDMKSNSLLKQWTYNENTTTNYNINVAGFKTGIYVLKCERNGISKSIELVIK